MPGKPSNPLRGVERREGLRIVRLAKSERRIEDPADAGLAHDLFVYFKWSEEVPWHRVANLALWVLLPLLALWVLLTALASAWVAAIISLAFVVSLVYFRIQRNVDRRRMYATAELNGWS